MFYINFYNQNSSFALSNAERKLRYHTKLNEERHEEVKQQNWERKREKKYCLDRGAERRKTNQRKRKEKTLQRKTSSESFDNLPLKTRKQKEKLLKNFTKLFQIHQPRR